MLARKRLVLCVPMQLQGPLIDLFSSGGQPCIRGMQRSPLSSEYCTVHVLEGLKNLSALWNSGVFAFQGLQCMAVNGNVYPT